MGVSVELATGSIADRPISPFEPEEYSENVQHALESYQEDGADMPGRLINDRQMRRR